MRFDPVVAFVVAVVVADMSMYRRYAIHLRCEKGAARARGRLKLGTARGTVYCILFVSLVPKSDPEVQKESLTISYPSRAIIE
jgi:hypothetical protein